MSKTTTFHTLILSLLFLLFASPGKAQHVTAADGYDANKLYYWSGLHVGGGTYLFNSGFDASLLLRNKFVFSLKAGGGFNDSGLFDNSHENIEADEYALLFGIKLTDRPYGNWIAQ